MIETETVNPANGNDSEINIPPDIVVSEIGDTVLN